MPSACWDSAQGSRVAEKGRRQKGKEGGGYSCDLLESNKTKVCFPGGSEQFPRLDSQNVGATGPQRQIPQAKQGQPTTAPVTHSCSLLTLSGRNPALKMAQVMGGSVRLPSPCCCLAISRHTGPGQIQDILYFTPEMGRIDDRGPDDSSVTHCVEPYSPGLKKMISSPEFQAHNQICKSE